MTAEGPGNNLPQRFMVMSAKMQPIPITEMRPHSEKGNPHIFNDFRKAVEFHNWLYKSGKASKENPVTVRELNRCVSFDYGMVEDADFCAIAEALSKIKEFGDHEMDYYDGLHWKEKANKLIALQIETMDKVDEIKCTPPPSMQCGH